jgi:hypothetical protein
MIPEKETERLFLRCPSCTRRAMLRMYERCMVCKTDEVEKSQKSKAIAKSNENRAAECKPGTRYGHLEVVGPAPRLRGCTKRRVITLCDCGRKTNKKLCNITKPHHKPACSTGCPARKAARRAS